MQFDNLDQAIILTAYLVGIGASLSIIYAIGKGCEALYRQYKRFKRDRMMQMPSRIRSYR